jgi:acetate CoA/acetoacetate CoA-transferase beta subunit
MTLPSSPKDLIAWRVAKELNYGEIVNLGIGTPTLVSNYISPEMNITFQSENGFVGMGALAKPGEEIPELWEGSDYVPSWSLRRSALR